MNLIKGSIESFVRALDDVDVRLKKSEILGGENENAIANVKHFLQEDLKELRHELADYNHNFESDDRVSMQNRANNLESSRKKLLTKWENDLKQQRIQDAKNVRTGYGFTN